MAEQQQVLADQQAFLTHLALVESATGTYLLLILPLEPQKTTFPVPAHPGSQVTGEYFFFSS